MFVVKSWRGPTHWWSQGSKSLEGSVPPVAMVVAPVCNAVHCGSHGRCAGLKVVPRCY